MHTNYWIFTVLIFLGCAAAFVGGLFWDERALIVLAFITLARLGLTAYQAVHFRLTWPAQQRWMHEQARREQLPRCGKPVTTTCCRDVEHAGECLGAGVFVPGFIPQGRPLPPRAS